MYWCPDYNILMNTGYKSGARKNMVVTKGQPEDIQNTTYT